MLTVDLSPAVWRKSTPSNGEGGACVEVAFAQAVWRKSGRSNGAGGACVEVATAGDVVAVGDSKDRTGPALVFTAGEWTAFLAGLATGQFDSP